MQIHLCSFILSFFISLSPNYSISVSVGISFFLPIPVHVLIFYYIKISADLPALNTQKLYFALPDTKKRTSGFYKKPPGPSFFWTILFSQPSFFFSALYYDACGLLPAIRSSMPSKFCSRSHGSYKSDAPACAAAYKIHRDIHSVPGVFHPARSTVQHYKHCRCELFHQTPKAL